MEIEIKGKEQQLSGKELEELFLSVEWSSGHYPDKLEIAMKNYPTVYTAWDGDKLVGLLSAMDDGVMTAYIHYLLVRPDYQGKGVGEQLLESLPIRCSRCITTQPCFVSHAMLSPSFTNSFSRSSGAIGAARNTLPVVPVAL